MVVMVRQVFIGGFWKLASYGLGPRGKRKHKGIPVWPGLIGQFYVCLYLV